MKKLKNKVAVVYGNGAVGAATAAAFASEGARVFLAGRTQDKLDAIRTEILKAGGTIETAEVDALDEHAVVEHLNAIVGKEGRIDISFNAIGIPQTGVQGIPLVELALENFMRPLNTYVHSHFITATTAAKHMMKQGSGVILMHTPNASRLSSPFVGGMIPAWSAMEALCRSLSLECAQRGVRSLCLLTTGLPETPLIDEVWNIHRKYHNITFGQFHEAMEGQTHRKRLTTLREFKAAAVFAASDEGSAITGTVFNLTAGLIVN